MLYGAPAIPILSSRRAAVAGLLVGLFAVACSPTTKAPVAPVTVFAAASLTDALDQIATVYENTSGQTVRLSFGASGSIARQIQAGAPADVVVLADPVWMDRLRAADLLAPGTRRDLLRNHLVLIAAADARTGADPFAWLSGADGKLVIGDPESVPAGAYARTWLQKTERWDGLQTRIVTATDVRAVRTFVERGEAGLGIVYRSDTIGSSAVKIVAEPAMGDLPAIVYPAASTRAGALRAASFLAFLKGPEAAQIFSAQGFEPIS